MTVKEVIEKLAQFDEDTVVTVYDGWFYPVEKIEYNKDSNEIRIS